MIDEDHGSIQAVRTHGESRCSGLVYEQIGGLGRLVEKLADVAIAEVAENAVETDHCA